MNYFFVNRKKKLGHFVHAPTDKNKKHILGHQMMNRIRKGDVFFQNAHGIFGFAIAKENVRKELNPIIGKTQLNDECFIAEIDEIMFPAKLKLAINEYESIFSIQNENHFPFVKDKSADSGFNPTQNYLSPLTKEMFDVFYKNLKSHQSESKEWDKAIAFVENAINIPNANSSKESLNADMPKNDFGFSLKIGNPLQQIFFGAPGTGKSHKVNELVGEHESYLAATDKDVRRNQFSQCGCAKANHYADVLSKPETFNQDVFAIDNLGELERLLESCEGDDKVKNPRHSALRAYIDFVSQPMVFRTTFHPDYDYAQFVGSYKPKKDKDDPKRIVYDFVPQVFAKAYKKAKETSEPVYLVIEEINRGNCAQIFGDIFQLLDRNESGESQYEIDVDSDFAEWLGESKIKLPANFNILATMNTSDQSLFPMDSAFKRRFDWEYVPIRYVKDSKCGDNWNADGFEIKLDENTSFSWLHFLKKINADIYKVTESEDKQMGEFFVKPKDNVIDLDMFRSKVLFYLWDSVYKDEPDKKAVFHFNYPEKNGSRVTFQSLFGDDANAIEIIKQMMKNLDKAYESKDDSEFKNFKIVSEQ